jgi:hypothetical protein
MMRSVDDRLGFSTFVGHEMNALPGLLQSVQTYFDEIVVVCTNTLPDDGTWEYLRDLERQWFPAFRPYRLAVPFEAGAFDFGYIRSAAAHLNSCGYVFMLDADERVTSNHLEALRGVHKKALAYDLQILAFQRHNWYDGPFKRESENKAVWPDWQSRMIRNNGVIWWRRPVHEKTLYGPLSKYHDVVGCGDVVIHHHHDWFHKDATNKAEVYTALAASDPEWRPSYMEDLLPADEMRRRAVRKLYTDLLKRSIKPEELRAWDGSPLSIEDIEAQIRASEEFNALP